MLNTIALADSTFSSMKTITEMSALYHVSLRTLRFYEDRGLIQPARIGTQRLYAEKDEVRLQIVLKGKHLGFTLSEIEQLILSNIDGNPNATRLSPDRAATAVLTPALIAGKIEELEQTRAATNDAIAELQSRMREMAE